MVGTASIPHTTPSIALKLIKSDWQKSVYLCLCAPMKGRRILKKECLYSLPRDMRINLADGASTWSCCWVRMWKDIAQHQWNAVMAIIISSCIRALPGRRRPVHRYPLYHGRDKILLGFRLARFLSARSVIKWSLCMLRRICSDW